MNNIALLNKLQLSSNNSSSCKKVVALMVMLVHQMVKATATTNFFET